MKIEHFAVNVEDPLAMSDWYTQHLGLKIVLQIKEKPYKTFMADSSGNVMIEMYKDASKGILPYKNMHPLTLHLAFVSENPDDDKKRLIEAGATLVSDDLLGEEERLVMLRDPWGVAIQLCKRGKPLLADS